MAWNPIFFGVFLFLFLFFFCGKGCISTNLSDSLSGPMASPERKDGDTTNTVCYEPYYLVGDYCLLIDNIFRGPWDQMRDLCKDIGGDLVNLKDANTLYEISQYLKSHGMDDVSYWVGATDESKEGKWVWSSDSTPVKGGTPLWGHLNGQQPDGGEDQNCAALLAREFHYMHDDACDGMTYGVICQPTTSEELMLTGDVENGNTFNESSSNECPSPYVMIGGACLQVIPEMNFTWTEAKDLCDGFHTHLVKIDDANFLGSIYDYLTEGEIRTYLWIGGTDEASEDDWVWHDATPVKRGTPFWDVNDDEVQEPAGRSSQNCAYIRYSDSYLYRDNLCTDILGAICQYDM